jgi:isopropylmalate/homocitrate/citramalate synthase
MLDIVEIINGNDMNVMDSMVSKAANVLSIQIGDLEYAKDFGVDFRFFLESDFQFQNESFKAYLVQRLTESQVNVATVIDTVESLFTKYTYYVGDVRPQNGGLIL